MDMVTVKTITMILDQLEPFTVSRW
jgi:hypothetical protein